MKLFLRGLLALAFVAALSLTATAADKGDCGGCGTGAADAKSRRFGKRIDSVGQRVDRAAESYFAAGERVGGFFSRLAGPPVEPVAGPAFGGKKGGPYTQPGTLVFPQHPFARSPRDFFMDP